MLSPKLDFVYLHYMEDATNTSPKPINTGPNKAAHAYAKLTKFLFTDIPLPFNLYTWLSKVSLLAKKLDFTGL